MRFNQLVNLLTLTSFMSGSLSACVGGGTVGPGVNNSADARLAAQDGVNNDGAGRDDKNLWSNISYRDLASVDSDEYFYLDNRSNHGASLVGCDSYEAIATHWSDDYFPSHSYAPRTTIIPAQWQDKFDKDLGMLDPAHLKDNYLRFHATGRADINYNCYYRIYVPEAGKNLYFKLTHHLYNYQTQNDIDKENQASNDAILQVAALESLGVSAALNSYWLYSFSWKLYNKRLRANNNAVSYINQTLWDRKANFISELNTELRDYLNGDRASLSYDLYAKFIAIYKLDTRQYPKSRLAMDLREVNNLKFTTAFDEEGSLRWRYQISADGAERLSQPLPIMQSKWWQLEARYHSSSLTPSDEIFHGGYNALAHELDPNGLRAFDRMAVRDLTKKLTPADLRIAYGSRKALADEAYKTAAEEVGERVLSPFLFNLITIVNVAFDVAMVADIVWGIFATGDSQFGNFNTSLNHLHIEEVSPAEANSFNANHDSEHQIMANTKVIQDPHNDRVNTAATLHFVDNDVDQQFGISVSIQPQTTPFMRWSSEAKQDPWLGDIDKVTHSENFNSAVMLITINDVNSGGPLHDVRYQMTVEQALEQGVSRLAQDYRLAAPRYQVQQVQSLAQGSKLVYAPWLKSGPYQESQHGLKFGSISGLFLNTNQQTSVKVSLANGASSAISSGAGLALTSYIVDESGNPQLLSTIISDSLRNDYQAQAAKNGQEMLPYLYSKFSCRGNVPVGGSCDLNLELGGSGNQKFTGHLYLSDKNSITQVIPVYLDYHLLVEPMGGATVTAGGLVAARFKVELANTSNEDYSAIAIGGLPAGIVEVSNSCRNGLAATYQCTIEYDARSVAPGNYNLQLRGVSARVLAGLAINRVTDESGLNSEARAQIAASDSQDFRLVVQSSD